MIFQTSFYKSKKLLLIEDCEPVRASIKGMLQQIGFEDITTAADALQAVAATKKAGFDFILADFDLGAGQDALQCFADMHQQAQLKVGCCFLLMSAEPRRLPVLGALNGAPDAFILKPFSYLELEKRLAKAWNHRLKLRKAYQSLQDGDTHSAQLELDQVINARNSSSLLALRLMGEVLLQEGSFAAAQKLYEQVLQQRDFSWAQLGRAVALLQQRDFVTAQTELQQLTESDDIRPEALQWLAAVYLLQQDYSQAVLQLSELVKIQPTHIDAHQAIACAQELDGKFDDAVKCWQKLIQQYRFSGFDRAGFYLALARLWLNRALETAADDMPGAVKKASDALASMPNKVQNEQTDAAVALLRARFDVLNGNYANAHQQLNQLNVSSLPADPACLLDAAALALALGEMKLAEHYLQLHKEKRLTLTELIQLCHHQRALHMQQREPQLRQQIRQHNQSGMDLLAQGKAADALTTLNRAFAYMPCNPSLLLNMLQALTELPADKKRQPLAKRILAALEFCSKTAANQQRLATLLPKLPELYL